jgi:hypothetical protein
MADEPLKYESTIWLFGRLVDGLTLGTDRFARVYGFAFHGEYFEMTTHSLFRVTGTGTPLNNNSSAATTGLGRIPRGLASDLSVWPMDVDDLSVRLDAMSGRLERILLDVELASEGLQDFVRGTSELGAPSNLGPRRSRRARRWRSDDE